MNTIFELEDIELEQNDFNQRNMLTNQNFYQEKQEDP